MTSRSVLTWRGHMWLAAQGLWSTAMVASAVVPAMDWGDEDFLALAALLLALCGGVELAVRTVPGRAARTAAISDRYREMAANIGLYLARVWSSARP